MKKWILIVVFSLLCLGGNAQYLPDASDAPSREQLEKSLSKARGGRTAGIVLTAFGSSSVVVGSALLIIGGVVSLTGAAIGGTTGAIVGAIGRDESGLDAQQGAQQGLHAGVGYLIGGLASTGTGIACMGAGIPLIVVGSKRAHRAKEQLEAAPVAVQVAFGPTRCGGLGLSLNFRRWPQNCLVFQEIISTFAVQNC